MLDHMDSVNETESVSSTPGNENTYIKSFLTFIANGLTYCVDTVHVVEIISEYSPRSIPMVPDYIRGIINLKGKVLPVIDFRLRLGCVDLPPSQNAIVLQNDNTIICLIVDNVRQVIDIDMRKSAPIPVENKQELTSGMVSLDDGTVILVFNFDALIE